MEQFAVRGGNPLRGEVSIAGAKNAALGILAASIMSDDDVVIRNLPDVSDVNTLLEAISDTGASVRRLGRHEVQMNGSSIQSYVETTAISEKCARAITCSERF